MVNTTSTLYHCGTADISADMSPMQALRAIVGWASGITDIAARVETVPIASAEEPGTDPDRIASDIVKTMRRDMKLKGKLGGLSLVLLGLVVPVEVYGIAPDTDKGYAIKFLAKSSPPTELRMSVTLAARLDARAADMLHSLAPALAAFLLSHGLRAADDLKDDMRLPRTGARPRIPQGMLDAATSVPLEQLNSDVHIAECVAKARRSLRATGYRVPALGHVSLTDVTLEHWLDTHVSALDRLAALHDQMTAAAQAVQDALQQYTRAMVAGTAMVVP